MNNKTMLKLDISGLIFDYGGTIDTNGTHWFEVFCKMYAITGIMPDKEALRKAYVFAEQEMERNGATIKPTDTFYDNLQQKINYQVNYLAQHHQIKINSEKVNELISHCYSFARKTVKEQSKILSKLATKYPLVLVSNFYGNLQSVLEDFEIAQYFCSVIESGKVGIRKPDPQIFRLGVSALQMEPNQVAVVGDSYKNDIAPARQVGCNAIWLKGIGWDSEEKTDETADYIITTFEDILYIINP